MKFRTLFFSAASLVAVPGLIFLANLVWFAFFGHGFLPPTGESFGMAYARLCVTALSFGGAVVLVEIGVTK